MCALNAHNVTCELYVDKVGWGKDSRTGNNKFKATTVEIIQPEEQRDKRLKKNGQSLRDVWDIKSNNIHKMGIPVKRGVRKKI